MGGQPKGDGAGQDWIPRMYEGSQGTDPRSSQAKRISPTSRRWRPLTAALLRFRSGDSIRQRESECRHKGRDRHFSDVSKNKMRATLIIISVLIALIGIGAGFHQVIQVPPDHTLAQARLQIEDLPLREADVVRLRAMLDEGIQRNRKERRRLESRLNTIYVLQVAVGCVGICFGLYGFRRKNSPAQVQE